LSQPIFFTSLVGEPFRNIRVFFPHGYDEHSTVRLLFNLPWAEGSDAKLLGTFPRGTEHFCRVISFSNHDCHGGISSYVPGHDCKCPMKTFADYYESEPSLFLRTATRERTVTGPNGWRIVGPGINARLWGALQSFRWRAFLLLDIASVPTMPFSATARLAELLEQRLQVLSVILMSYCKFSTDFSMAYFNG